MTEQQIFEQSAEKVISLTAAAGNSGIMPMMKPRFGGCSSKDKTLSVLFDVVKWELNPQGIMHGGMITTAVDTTCGILAHSYAANKYLTTVEMSMHFLKPVREGDCLEIIAKAVNTGKTIITLTAEGYIKNRDNQLVLTSSSTYMVIKNIITDISRVTDGQVHVEKQAAENE